MDCSLPHPGEFLCPKAEDPLGARVLNQRSPGAYCRCLSLGRPEIGEAKQLETQLMIPAVLIPSAEVFVQVPPGPGHCIAILLLHLTQIDDYFFILLFLVSESETRQFSAELQQWFSSESHESHPFTWCSWPQQSLLLMQPRVAGSAQAAQLLPCWAAQSPSCTSQAGWDPSSSSMMELMAERFWAQTQPAPLCNCFLIRFIQLKLAKQH